MKRPASTRGHTNFAPVVLLAVAALAAGCGGDGPSADEALGAFKDFDKAAVASHNAVLPKFERIRGCVSGATYITMRECAPAANAYVSAVKREQRKIKSAYEDAPDYVRRVYRAYYRVHHKANDADLAFGEGAVEFTRSSKTLDVARGRRAIEDMKRAAARSARLEERTSNLLDKARAESEDYVRSL